MAEDDVYRIVISNPRMIRENSRKLTKKESGYSIKDIEDISSIRDDEFRCKTCRVYSLQRKSCGYVEGEILSNACCNWYTDSGKNDPKRDGEGMLGFKEGVAILNGTPRIVFEESLTKK